jgi:hypothetical protein
MVLSFTGLSAQGKDKVEALRVSFISQKLDLSTQEAQGFWPLYNEYNDKIKALRKNFRQQYGSVSTFKTDKEADDFLQAEMRMKQSELDLHKEYFEKIKKVLGSKKTAMLIRAEEEFKKVIIQTIKGNSDS